MWDQIVDRVRQRFAAARELLELIPESALTQKLSIRSNEISQQYWCIVGARESYSRGIQQGGWAGFSCSLTKADLPDRAKMLAGLDRSAAAFETAVVSVEWDEARAKLLLDLLEHETQHQGQLIRYVYGLGLKFPESWLKRWALEQAKGVE
jgi:hypothetical protein